MSNPPLQHITRRIAQLNPVHSKKLLQNAAYFDNDRYRQLAADFFDRYLPILQDAGHNLDYATDCYLQMLADVAAETIDFMRTGRYSSSTFTEVNARVYAHPQVMEYYMHGLMLSQFLWKHHYRMLTWFMDGVAQRAGQVKDYLEVGVGHGLYLAKALELLSQDAVLTAVDISETSINMTQRFIWPSRIQYHLQDIFSYPGAALYDFITLGEVLEHVEEPLKLLQKLHTLLRPGGTLFFTTPTNAPAIDHIYLFNNVDEIRTLAVEAGFSIEEEQALLSEEVSPERAERFKIATLYGAFLRKPYNR